MKEVHKGFITEAEFGGFKYLVFNFDSSDNARVESLFEQFAYHPRIKITIEDIREPKERALDCFRDIEVVAQVSMAAPI